MVSSMPKREDSLSLLNEYIEAESLKQHCEMVADTMELNPHIKFLTEVFKKRFY